MYDAYIELCYSDDDGRWCISKDPIGLEPMKYGLYNYVDDTNIGVDFFGLKSYSKRVQSLPKHLRRRPKWRKKTKTDLEAKFKKRNGNLDYEDAVQSSIDGGTYNGLEN